MSANPALARGNAVDSPSPSPAGPVAPTGYRVSLLPGALEISARLSSAEELQLLIQLLQANMVIWKGTKTEQAS
jgi:hypothetical protein